MSTIDRKARLRAYKETPPPAGVYQVRNTATGRLLVGASKNLPGMLNRVRFELDGGMHRDAELQADWNELGPDAFTFEALDQLKLDDDSTDDVTEDLRVLHQMWLEKLADAGESFYRESQRGV